MIDPSVLEGVLAAGLGAGAYAFARRFGTAGALGELETANRVLQNRVHELHESDERKTHEIAELRARTDVSLALAPLLEWTVSHETRAQERHDHALAHRNLEDPRPDRRAARP
jgi:hypothetical protein